MKYLGCFLARTGIGVALNNLIHFLGCKFGGRCYRVYLAHKLARELSKLGDAINAWLDAVDECTTQKRRG
jgi:hypothetical protein